MMEHVPLDQTCPKMNKNENMRDVVHMTWKLAAQKENMLLMCEIYLLANSTLQTCALEAVLMIEPSLTDWWHLLQLSSHI
jgi:hypothetical protein